jgi:hypothetical protein
MTHLLIRGVQIIFVVLCCLLTPIDVFVIQSCSLLEHATIPIVLLDILHFVCSRIDSSTYRLDWMILLLDASTCVIFATTSRNYCSSTAMFVLRYISIIRMCKLVTLRSYFKELLHVTMTKTRKNLLRCSYFIIMLAILVILLSSLWFWIACYDGLKHCLHRNNWVSNDSVLEVHSTFSILIRSIYFIVQTVYTIGFGDIHPVASEEMIFACIVMLVGITFNGLLISVVSTLFQNMNLPYILYQKEIHLMKEILKANKLPESIAKQLLNFKRLQYQKQLGCGEETVLDKLPRTLKLNLKGCILERINGEKLLNSFFGVNKEDYIENTSFASFPKGFCFYRKGQQPSNIINIRSGTILGTVPPTMSEGESNVHSEARFGTGDVIAEYEVAFQKNTQLTYLSQTYCEVSFLPKSFVKNLLENCKIEYSQSEADVVLSYESENADMDSNMHAPIINRNVTKKSTFLPNSVIQKHQQLMARLLNKSSSVLPLSMYGNSLLSIPTSSPMNTKSQVSLLSKISKSLASFEKLNKHSSYFSLPSKSRIYQSSLSTLNTHKNWNSFKSNHVHGSSPLEKFMLYVRMNIIWNYGKAPVNQVWWRCLLLFVYIYNSLITVIRIATYIKCNNGISKNLFDYTLILDYGFDFLLLLNTVCKLDNWFHCETSCANDLIYFVVVLPLDILTIFSVPVCFLRINKLLSTRFISSTLSDLRNKASKVSANIQAESFQDNVVSSILINPILYVRNVFEGGLEVIEQFVWTMIFLVWLTVGWNAVHHYDFTDETSNLISSLYWCLTTLTTTGYGDITSETTMECLLCLLNMCIGPVIFASAIAYFITFSQGSDAYIQWLNYKQLVSRNFLLNHSGNDTNAVMKSKSKNKSSSFGVREEWLYDVGVPLNLKVS